MLGDMKYEEVKKPILSPAPSLKNSISDAGGRVGDIWKWTGKYRILHLTWFAFFLSFVVWFNFAPFANTIQDDFGLTDGQRKTIGLCNIALTVPARVFIGMALDRFGPRKIYQFILIYSLIPCLLFATAQSYSMLIISRLLLGVVGAGFVVGIRMVAEWFPPKEVGMAEGIYGGWGNFGSAFAAFTLPTVASYIVGGDEGWRWAIGMTGVIAAIYGLVYGRSVEDTPPGRAYRKPKRQGALEVTNRKSVYGLALLTIPLNLILAVIAFRIWRDDVLSTGGMYAAFVLIGMLLLFQLRQMFSVNRPALNNAYPQSDQYPFQSVAILCVSYFCTFGSELAVVTILPTFFQDTWDLSDALAGATASAFAFMNLFARPTGGLLSDLLGSRRNTLRSLFIGIIIGYLGMSLLGSAWPVPVAVGITMFCSFFDQAGEGAVYAIVPLVKKRVSGQISGLVGAYGNVGAITFLTVNLFVSTQVFFLTITAAAVIGFAISFFLPEPEDSFADNLLDDDTGKQSEAPIPVMSAQKITPTFMEHHQAVNPEKDQYTGTFTPIPTAVKTGRRGLAEDTDNETTLPSGTIGTRASQAGVDKASLPHTELFSNMTFQQDTGSEPSQKRLLSVVGITGLGAIAIASLLYLTTNDDKGDEEILELPIVESSLEVEPEDISEASASETPTENLPEAPTPTETPETPPTTESLEESVVPPAPMPQSQIQVTEASFLSSYQTPTATPEYAVIQLLSSLETNDQERFEGLLDDNGRIEDVQEIVSIFSKQALSPTTRAELAINVQCDITDNTAACFFAEESGHAMIIPRRMQLVQSAGGWWRLSGWLP